MWPPTDGNLSYLLQSNTSFCSYLYGYATLNSCKYLKSKTHLWNAQVNNVSSVNKVIVKICMVVDMLRKNWLWIVVAGCGLHNFVSARFGSFWVVANFSLAEVIKNIFFTAITKIHTIARIAKKQNNFIFSSLVT